MFEIEDVFPGANQQLRDALENAPQSSMEIRNAIRRQEPLALDDPRYVNTAVARKDRFESDFLIAFNYDQETGEFLPPDGPIHALFFGHVGSGKSTELTRITEKLRHRDRYWVVRVNLADLIDLNDVSYSDVWLAIAEAFVEQLGRQEIDLPQEVVNGFYKWFSEQVTIDEVMRDYVGEIRAEAGIEAGVPLIAKFLAKFTSSIKTASSHRETVRTAVRNTYFEFSRALNQLITAATEALVRKRIASKILFVVDGTDRLSEKDAQQLFVDRADQLTQVDCIAVYTAPLALRSNGLQRDRFQSLVLPTVMLNDFDTGKRRDSAYAAMREMVLKRCHYTRFDRLETLDELISYSGGHMRDVLFLLQYALRAAKSGPITLGAVEVAAMDLASEYQPSIRRGDYSILVEYARSPINVGIDPITLHLIQRSALLEYNSGRWRQPHPVVRLLAGFAEAEQKAKNPISASRE